MKRLGLILWLGMLCTPVLAGSGLKNQLPNHPSAYLAMHGSDPVKWQTWSADAISKARRQNKLLYVSIGYFSCHWCHVMQKESYKNKEIAALVNRNFIPVKVDRELHPALDQKLIEFVERTRGYSGWPLNVFLTPEGYPLLGIVYLPPADFKNLVTELAQRWQTERAELKTMARQAAEELHPPIGVADPELPAGVGEKYEKAFINAALTLADEDAGGFGNQSKFPSVPQIRYLLDIYQRHEDERIGKFVRLTLDNMSRRGMYDLLGGGFFRYSTDPTWDVPHFEKMLYDNALLAELYMDAGAALKHSAYTQTAQDTLDFMLRAMNTRSGALAASLSALDDKGIEGGYYLWYKDDVKKRLTADEYRVVEAGWGFDGGPTLAHGHLPIHASSLESIANNTGMTQKKIGTLFRSAKQKLFELRQQRVVPKDTKGLAAWNGLALRAFTRAAQLYQRDDYRQAAAGLKTYLAKTLWDGKQLMRSRSGNKVIGAAALEDYAYVADGLLAWASFSGNDKDYQLAATITQQAWKRFTKDGGWLLAENTLIPFGASEAAIADSVMPSPSTVLMQVSMRLSERTKYKNLRERTLVQLNRGHDLLMADPFWYASHIALINQVQTGD